MFARVVQRVVALVVLWFSECVRSGGVAIVFALVVQRVVALVVGRLQRLCPLWWCSGCVRPCGLAIVLALDIVI